MKLYGVVTYWHNPIEPRCVNPEHIKGCKGFTKTCVKPALVKSTDPVKKMLMPVKTERHAEDLKTRAMAETIQAQHPGSVIEEYEPANFSLPGFGSRRRGR